MTDTGEGANAGITKAGLLVSVEVKLRQPSVLSRPQLLWIRKTAPVCDV